MLATAGVPAEAVADFIAAPDAAKLAPYAETIQTEFEISPAQVVTNLTTVPRVPISALLLILCGLCTSVMWGGIFNLAVEGLGKYTAQASGIFMMMVVGGGVMPLVQSWIAGEAGYMASYWLIVAMLAYILFYGLIGSKNVNTDIPVTEEEEVDARNL